MIQFLKERTFAVNHVFRESWLILKSRYFSIAGLCLCLFLTSNMSGVLAFYLQDLNPMLAAFMALVFLVAYFGIQLTLFKFVLKLIDKQSHISLTETIPASKELWRFFLAMLSVSLAVFVFYLLFSVAAWPLIYWIGVESVVTGGYLVSAIISLYFLIRIAFYPFFIVDKGSGAWEAIRLSLALTKGNVINLLSIMLVFALLHLLYIYFNYLGYPIVSTVLSILSSFLVVPLSSVVVAFAYRDMVKNYSVDQQRKGGHGIDHTN